MPVKTHAEFKSELKDAHPKIKLLSPYEGWREQIKFKCLECKTEGQKYTYSLLTKGCGVCNRKVNDGPHGNRFTPKDYMRKVREIHGSKISVLGDYVGGRVKTEHECNLCGNIWQPLPEHILRGSGCNKCRGVSIEEKIKEHKLRLKQTHGIKIKLLKFGGLNKRVTRSKYECKCGNVWNTTAMTAEKHGCPACAPRKGRNGNRLKTIRIGRRDFDVQGYEEQALRWIIENTPTKASDIEVYAGGKVPFIKWEEAGKERYHFPDFYIRKQNRFCEVKSISTFGLRPFKRLTPEEMFESNKRKAIEAIAQGFKYRMLVMQGNGERIKLPEDWYTMSLRQLKRRIGWAD